jgi:GAF domain-containing protein
MSERSEPAQLPSAAAQLLDLLTDSPSVDTFLDQVVRLAAVVVPLAAACGLTVRRDGRPFTVSSSGELAARVDEIQYGAHQGPCLETLHTGRIVQVDDLTQDDRWGRYRGQAIAHGVVSSLSMPLTVDGLTIAAMNLYSHRANAFAEPVRRQAEAFAAQSAGALALTLRHADEADLHRQLGEALVSRSQIDQAIGILMGQQRCTASIAFDLLRQASQHRNRKLRDIARDIIVNVTGEPPQQPAGFATRAPRPGSRS